MAAAAPEIFYKYQRNSDKKKKGGGGAECKSRPAATERIAEDAQRMKTALVILQQRPLYLRDLISRTAEVTG